MKDFINSITNAARKFNPLDYAIFKICMISVGIIIGTYLSSFIINYISIIWVVVLITCIYIMFQLLRYTIQDKGDNKK